MKLAALLRPDRTASRPGTIDMSVVEEAVAHGIAPLLYRAVRDADAWERTTPDAQSRLMQVAREAVLLESARAAHLVRTVAALEADGVRPLLFKGAALAASHYREPWLRTRGDSDLLVRIDEAERTGRVLERLAFARVPRPAGSLVTQQARYEGASQGLSLAYDVHWRVVDPHAFATALPYQYLERRSVGGHPSGARSVANVDALAIACVHRAAHHYDTDNLLCTHDIWVIARDFGDQEWAEFVRLADRWALRSIFRRGLGLAADTFGLQLPIAAQQGLAGGEGEPTRIFVGGKLRKVDILMSDLRALGAWRDRLELLKSHLFPGSSYLSASSPAGIGLAVPIVRAVRGARRWWRPL